MCLCRFTFTRYSGFFLFGKEFLLLTTLPRTWVGADAHRSVDVNLITESNHRCFIGCMF